MKLHTTYAVISYHALISVNMDGRQAIMAAEAQKSI